jgi:hypothetical protein
MSRLRNMAGRKHDQGAALNVVDASYLWWGREGYRRVTFSRLRRGVALSPHLSTQGFLAGKQAVWKGLKHVHLYVRRGGGQLPHPRRPPRRDDQAGRCTWRLGTLAIGVGVDLDKSMILGGSRESGWDQILCDVEHIGSRIGRFAGEPCSSPLNSTSTARAVSH